VEFVCYKIQLVLQLSQTNVEQFLPCDTHVSPDKDMQHIISHSWHPSSPSLPVGYWHWSQ